MKKLKLKKGDTVWVRLPTNAKIKRVNQQFGYTLVTTNGTEYSYFGDNEVALARYVPKKSK